eukprot:tig00001532_g9278.t1
MKTIQQNQVITIPDGVKVEIKARKVRVTGPRGTLSRNFQHVPNLDLTVFHHGKKVKAEMWFSNRKQAACIRTICTHIQNMIIGVTKGYQYKMRFVYAHFPVNATITSDKKIIEIRNFLGEKIVRRCEMLPGVSITRSEKVKDEIVLEGNDVTNVSLSAAQIWQTGRVTDKDIRKFLDGIYVSEKGNIVQDS